MPAELTETPAASAKYRRVLLKLSGEALMGDQSYGLDPKIVGRIAQEVKSVHELGVQVAVVIGGGNIFRGLKGAAQGMERATADYMGMLATVINSLAVQSALERHGVVTRVLSAIGMQAVCEPYIRRRAIRHMEKGRVVIFAAGTGNPFFTTDTAASLRAIEIGAELLIKATKVDGVYSADPKKDSKATRYAHLTFDRILTDKLMVMDATAMVLCRDNNIPLRVYDMTRAGDLMRIVQGDRSVGTLVDNGEQP